MHSAKKRIWIEILLHLVFWAGVFYALTTLNNSHIYVKVKSRDIYQHSVFWKKSDISAYVYLTLFFLALLFYGNIFWVFRKAVRYKNNLIRVLICAGWFILVFSTNYLVVGPFFDQSNPIPNQPQPASIVAQRERVHLDSVRRANRIANPPLSRPIVDQREMTRQDSVRHPNPPKAVPRGMELVIFMISDWLQLQPILLFAFLVILGISFAYFFLKQWVSIELIQLSTENKFLRSQINPHFLFNTLNNLFSLAQREGKGNLADKIAQLSGMMRYMIYESNTDSVPLANELSYLEDCIALHQMRYAGNEAAVTFQYPEPATVAVVQVAPMLFIPFLENAFKHGVAIGRDSSIAVTISVNQKKLIFTCENADYSSVKKLDAEKGGIGLENVKRRLELVYPGRHQLRACHEDGKYIVNLQIDLS